MGANQYIVDAQTLGDKQFVKSVSVNPHATHQRVLSTVPAISGSDYGSLETLVYDPKQAYEYCGVASHQDHISVELLSYLKCNSAPRATMTKTREFVRGI